MSNPTITPAEVRALKMSGGRLVAKGQKRKPEMNGTERDYADYLNLSLKAGAILWYAFESITLKLGKDCRFTVDFFVMMANGTLECHDTKGAAKRRSKAGVVYKRARIEDDARVKLATAAEKFPFVFKAVYQDGGRWVEEAF